MFLSNEWSRLKEMQGGRRSLNYEQVVFPDLAPAGIPHVVNFTPVLPVPAGGAGWRLRSDEDDGCLKWILRQAGLDHRCYRWETLQRRIPGMLRGLRVASLPEARTAIQRNQHLLWVAMEALIIGVTSFFRDRAVFETLQQRVLRDLQTGGGPVHIWSAGCSDGSELYSVAMLLAELNIAHRAKLVGTDCRRMALQAAEAGCYDTLSGVSPELQKRYFKRDGHRLRIVDWLRNLTAWRRADLMSWTEAGPWDLILCRNLGIYLQPAAASQLWARLRAGLRVGGVLMVGKAERPGHVGLRQIGPCLFQRDRS